MWLDCLELTRRDRRRPSVKRATGGRQADAVKHDLAHRQSTVVHVGELRKVADRAKAPGDTRVRFLAAGENADQG